MSNLVSVVVPFLNASRFLEEAVESVLSQSHSEWQLLLCDDGSTDDSTEMAQRYTLRYPHKVFYYEHAGHVNRGLSATRNLGLRHAKGRFLALLDSDDVWLPCKLRDQVLLLKQNPQAGMVYGATLYWKSWTGDPGDTNRDYQPPLGLIPNSVSSPGILIRYLQGAAAVPCPSSVLARRDIVERVGGFEDAFRGIYDDQVFYAKMLLAAPAYVADRTWDKYRIHADSMCAVAERAGNMGRERIDYLNWLERYLNDQQLSDSPLSRAVRVEKWRCRHPRLTRFHRAVRNRIRAHFGLA
jgi:glycosyltransferase involved in cell wall biosynthesis